jgi:hypothetical protein
VIGTPPWSGVNSSSHHRGAAVPDDLFEEPRRLLEGDGRLRLAERDSRSCGEGAVEALEGDEVAPRVHHGDDGAGRTQAPCLGLGRHDDGARAVQREGLPLGERRGAASARGGERERESERE